MTAKIGWIVLLIQDNDANENTCNPIEEMPCVVNYGPSNAPIPFKIEEEAIKARDEMMTMCPSCVYVIAQIEWTE